MSEDDEVLCEHRQSFANSDRKYQSRLDRLRRIRDHYLPHSPVHAISELVDIMIDEMEG
jgi:hypothetical protein